MSSARVFVCRRRDGGRPRRAWAQTVHTDATSSVDFSSFKTYSWPKTAPVPGNDITSQRIMDPWIAGCEAVEKMFGKKFVEE